MNLIYLVPLFFVQYSIAKRYDNYQIWSITPTTESELVALRDISTSYLDVVYWNDPERVNVAVEAIIPPGSLGVYGNRLESAGLEWTVQSINVQALLDKERPEKQLISQKRSHSSSEIGYRHIFNSKWLRSYHTIEEINTYMQYLAAKYPKLIKLANIGRTHEGRNITLMKLSGSGKGPRRAIYIDGGIHAREWISPATVVYIIDSLTRQLRGKAMYKDIDWYLLPVVNPDGYAYTMDDENPNRFWRKNRSPKVCDKRCCQEGVDLNRNFDWHWNTTGVSHDPCGDSYPGNRAFSEPESRAVRDFVTSNKNHIAAFFTLHSFGQAWLLPYSHANKTRPSDYKSRLYPAAKEAVQKLESVHGTPYVFGTGSDVLYEASGVSQDWAKGSLGINYTYCLELRFDGEKNPRDRSGFILPPAQIVPTGEETFAGILSVVERIRNEGQ